MTKQEYFNSLISQGLSEEEAYKLATEYQNSQQEEKDFKNKIGEGLKTVGTIGMLAGGIPLALANPTTTLTGIALGAGVDKLTNSISNNKYKTWGDFISSILGGSDQIWQFTNPGYFIGASKSQAIDNAIINKANSTNTLLNNTVSSSSKPIVSDEIIQKQLSKAITSLKQLYTSDEYLNRLQKVFPTIAKDALKAKVSEIIDNVIDVNNIKTLDLGDIGGKLIVSNQGQNFNTELVLNNALLKKDIYETIIHELGGHNATKLFDFSKISNFQNILQNLKQSNVGNNIMKYNSLIRPNLKPEVNNNKTLQNLANDINTDQEIRARAIVTLEAAKRRGMSIQDLLQDFNAPLNTKQLLAIFTKDSLIKYLTEFAALSGAIAVTDKETSKFKQGGIFGYHNLLWSTPKFVKNAQNKKDMRKKQFPGTQSYTNSRIYNKQYNTINGFIPNIQKNKLGRKFKNGGSMSGLEWAQVQKIVGTGNIYGINWFNQSINDDNIKYVDTTQLINNDQQELNNFSSLSEIMQEFSPKINLSNINILPVSMEQSAKTTGNKTSQSNSNVHKKSTKSEQFSYTPIKGSTQEIADKNAQKAERYIQSGGTFKSASKGILTWGRNDYKQVCSTGSFNVLWLLGLPKVSDNTNTDLSGRTLNQMGLSYLTTVDPKNPTKNGYTPRNGDTAVWPKFTRGSGKNAGKTTQHQATYLNGKWYSDTEQSKMSAYSSDPNEPLVKIYRING